MMRQMLIFAVLLTIFTSVYAQEPAEEATPTLACPVTSSNPILAMPADIAGYATAIEDYLSAGGSTSALVAMLRERGMLTPQNPTNYPYYGGVWFLDVTGDGYDDALVNIYSVPDDVSVLWLYACEGSVYHKVSEALIHTAPFDQYRRGLYVTYIGDYNGDEQIDIVYHILSCGMFCYIDVVVLTWGDTEQTLREVLRTQFSLGSNGDYHLEDINGDGIDEVIIRSDPVGPVSFGNVRESLTTYRWNGAEFIEVGSVLEPPRFGYEVIYDAISAMEREDTHTAIALYQTILAEPPPLPMDDTLRAQALFGLIVATAAQDGIPAAADEYATLLTLPQVSSSEGVHESLWVEFGRLFYQTAQVSGDLHAACSDTITVMYSSVYGARRLEYWGDYGIGTPAPRPEQVCPL